MYISDGSCGNFSILDVIRIQCLMQSREPFIFARKTTSVDRLCDMSSIQANRA